jgi:hypothetical protein
VVASIVLSLVRPTDGAGAAEEEQVVRCRNPGACWITAFGVHPGRTIGAVRGAIYG